MRSSRRAFFRSFGPGILFAGTAVGVSHLVQSTRAGADAGFGLVGIIVLALALKYPFFEFGPRYAAATGRSLVEGYRDIGRWAVWVYLALTATTGVIVEVAVVLFTAVLLRYALALSTPLGLIGAVLLLTCMLLLRQGRYRGLDLVIKGLVAVLTITTLVSAALVLPRADVSTVHLLPVGDGRPLVSLAFVVALVGWMPSGIDLNVWSSLWTLAKHEGAEPGDPAAIRRDFQVGYAATAVLALAFVVLGAVVMHGSGTRFDDRGTVFAIQLVDLYTAAIGPWVRPLVILAAVTAMFSTALAVVDGVPRAVDRAVTVLLDPDGLRPGSAAPGRFYWPMMLITAAITVVVLVRFTGTLTLMIDFATTLSFLVAPVLAALTLLAMSGRAVPPAHRPGRFLRTWCVLGILLLTGTAVAYAITAIRRF